MTSRGEREVCPKRKAMRGNKVLLVKTRQYATPLRFSRSTVDGKGKRYRERCHNGHTKIKASLLNCDMPLQLRSLPRAKDQLRRSELAGCSRPP
jgi:hypothetical protein